MTDTVVNTDILPLQNPPYSFGTLAKMPDDSTNSNQKDTNISNHNVSTLEFFSSSEARLCLEITQAIEKNFQTLFVELPSFAQDNALSSRIGNYMKTPKAQSVVIDAKGLNASEIIGEFIKQLSLDNRQDNAYYEFAKLMTDYFQQNKVLNCVIYNAQFLKKQDFDYLYELASLMYEKFPKQRHKPLIRFVFIGNKLVAPILRRKTNGQFKQFFLPVLTHTECVNALYLYTPPLERTELFYQTVATYAAAMRIATVGYPALLRHVLPLPTAPSLADKKNPENYLSTIINNKIDVVHHTELTSARIRLKQRGALRQSYNMPVGLLILALMICVGFFIWI